jgi:hypothetical protein
MAAMSTALTEFSTNGNSRTSTLSGHTVLRPKIVIEKRKVAGPGSRKAEYSFSVVYATEDANSEVLPEKVNMSCTVSIPLYGQSSDVAAVLAVLRDVIAGDEFGNSVDTQEFLS